MKLLNLLKLLSVAFAFSAISAHANESFKGYLALESGHEVYVDYQPPLANQPTVVLVNGLVYDLNRWDKYVNQLRRRGVGVIRYYFRGQLKTLLREVRQNEHPAFFKDGLTPNDFAKELAQILDALDIRRRVSVVGLSYGSVPAAEFAQLYPDRVDNLILMAPLVVSLDHYDAMGAWIRWNLDVIKTWWGPIWGPAAYDYYYDLIFRHYVKNLQITDDRIPPEMKDIPSLYKEAVFHQVRAARDFDLREYTFSKIQRVHLMLASEEDEPAYRDQIKAWRAWKKASKASLVYLEGSEHAIPDSSPIVASNLTLRMLGESQAFQGGKIHQVDTDGNLTELNSVEELP